MVDYHPPTCYYPNTLSEHMSSADKYTFNVGAPDSSIMLRGVKLMRACTEKRLTEEMLTPEAHMMQYGAPGGEHRFLKSLPKFLADQYGDPVDEFSLVQTSGATAGLFYMTSQIFPNKCTIYMPLEADGIDLAALERQWTEDIGEEWRKENKDDFAAMLYLVPTIHNPTGTVLAKEKCRALVKLARRFNVLIFSDDLYNILSFNGRPPKRLFAYDDCSDEDYYGNVISNGSFSKLLSPGLRLGWMELPKWIRKKYWLCSDILGSSGGISNFVGGVLAVGLEDGSVARLVTENRIDLAERCRALLAVLERELPAGFQLYARPVGGYFVFVRCPPGVSSTALEAFVQTQGIRFQEGWKFSSGDSKQRSIADSHLRLSWANMELDTIVEGAKLLCQAMRQFVELQED